MRVLLAICFLCSLLVPALARENTLNPGDTLQITVWQDPKLNRTVVVAPDGTIGFPLAGHLKAAGRTPEQLENALRERLSKNYTGKLDITVSLATVNQQEQAELKPKVYVTGEVLRPGPYIIQPPSTTVIQAITLAGGLGPFAARERIQVHRQIKGVDSIFLFNYNTYESGRDPTENIGLRRGDVIIVPERGLLE